MIRKSLLSLLLPLFLLLAQQGAIVHELGHFARDAQRVQRAELQQGQPQTPQQAPGGPCEKCVVFAHLSGAVAPAIPVFNVPQLTHALSRRVAIALRSADTPSARSRGPPFLL